MEAVGSRGTKGQWLRPALASAFALIAAATSFPVAAQAAAEIDLGPGKVPSVAIDSNDTAHIAWNGTESAHASLHYCRLPAGATACSPRLTLPTAGESLVRPLVFAGSGPVRILSYRYGLSPGPFARIFQYSSNDTGQSFGAAVPVGDIPMFDANPGPGESILTGGSGPAFQRVERDGSSANSHATFPIEQNFGTIGAVGQAGTTPVAIFEASLAIGFRRWTGSGDINNPATWTALSKIADETYPRLAPGPGGLFLLSSSSAALRVRSYVPGSPGEFKHLGDIQGTERVGPNSHIAQAADGSLEAVWVSTATGGSAIYEGDSGSGRYWNRTLIHAAGPIPVQEPRVAVGEQGSRAVVWVTTGTGGQRVFVNRLATRPPGNSPPNLRATGIEVTQGIQTHEPDFAGGELPSALGPFGNSLPGRPRYRGVKLAEASKTVVRLFANTDHGGVDGVLGRLFGYRDGKPLPGNPLQPENGRRNLTSSPCNCVLRKDRNDPKASYYFTLPDSWTHGEIDLRGEVSRLWVKNRFMLPGKIKIPTARSSAIVKPVLLCGTSRCAKDDKFELTKIPFTRTARIFIAPLRMLVEGQTSLPDPGTVFDAALKLHPGGERYVVLPYVSDLDVATEGKLKPTDKECKDRKNPDDCRNDLFYGRVLRWAVGHPNDADLPIGVNTQERGAANDSLYNLPHGHVDPTVPNEHEGQPAGFVNPSRPITSVGHELGHMIGRAHAGLICDGGGDSWPPDDRGYIQGVALDRYSLITRWGLNRPYNVFAAGIVGQPQQWYDVMSYCANSDEVNGPNAWISTRGWDSELAELNRYGKRVGFDRTSPAPVAIPSAAAAGRVAATPKAMLDVTASADAAGTRVENVVRTTGPSPRAPGSTYTLVGRNSAGAVVATAPMVVSSVHIHGGGFTSLHAAIPAGAVAVEVVRGGKVLARRQASANAPTVRVTSPRAGARVTGEGSVKVRWTAADADADPLTATVLYSRDDGKHWRTVGIGPSRGASSLPAAYFAASRKARVMVIASDGFRETAAVSGRFRAAGVRPRVRLFSPVAGARVSSAATLLLSGQAFDDALRLIGGRHLQWFDGKRSLGHGEHATARGLRPGLRQIRLVATDATGRRGSASVRVRVLATMPAFATLTVPSKISRKAKSLKITVATNVAGKLTTFVGKSSQAFAVGPKAKKLRVKLRPGRGKITLGMSLRSGGREVQTAVVVPRG